MSKRTIATIICAAALICGAIFSQSAQAGSVADFYKGRDIAVYVGAGAGGGYGLYTRALTEFMPRHIPGNPSMTPRFMSGSAGVKAANYVYNAVPKDGSALGVFLSSQPTSQAVGGRGVKYDAAKFHWLGRMVDIITVATVKRDAPATTIAEMKKKVVVIGATRPGSTTHMPFAIMNWALGTKFKIVTGYKGSGGVAMAYDRGEVQGAAAPWGTLRARRPHFLKDIQIVQIALAKDPQRQDVPLLMDLIKDPKRHAAVVFLSAQASIGRTLAAPPGTPSDRVAALRKAFDATMKDPAFLAAAKKRKMDLAPLSGAAVTEMVLEHLATPADVVRIAKKATGLK